MNDDKVKFQEGLNQIVSRVYDVIRSECTYQYKSLIPYADIFRLTLNAGVPDYEVFSDSEVKDPSGLIQKLREEVPGAFVESETMRKDIFYELLYSRSYPSRYTDSQFKSQLAETFGTKYEPKSAKTTSENQSSLRSWEGDWDVG